MSDSPDAVGPVYVVVSHLTIDPEGTDRLEEAFANRLGEVEQAAGFRDLEVWRDTHVPGSYTMVTWWDCEADFRRYMRSPAHRRSHARIPREPHAPRPRAVQRYVRIAT